MLPAVRISELNQGSQSTQAQEKRGDTDWPTLQESKQTPKVPVNRRRAGCARMSNGSRGHLESVPGSVTCPRSSTSVSLDGVRAGLRQPLPILNLPSDSATFSTSHFQGMTDAAVRVAPPQSNRRLKDSSDLFERMLE